MKTPPTFPAGAPRPMLMIAFFYPPSSYVGALRPSRFARYLERLGFPISVLAARFPEEKDPGIVDGVHRVRGEFWHNPRLDLTTRLDYLLRITLSPMDPAPLWAFRSMWYAARFMRQGARPVVFSTSPPLVTHWVGWWLKKRYGVRWIADFRDPFVGVSGRTDPRSRWGDPRMERAIFRNADVIIANTEPAAEIWRARYPEFRGKVHVIWNAFDPEEQLGPAALPERPYKVIAHVGSVYPTRYPTAVLDAVERLSTRGLIHPDNLRIHFVGTVQRESMPYTDVLNRLVDAGLVTCTDAMPRAEAQQIMSSSDYLLLLDLVEDRPSIQVPAKIFEYLRIGRPILALTKHGSAIEQVLAWSGIPHCIVPPDGPASEIDQKILDFLSWPSSPAQIDPKFEEIFSPEHQARYLASLISPSRP